MVQLSEESGKPWFTATTLCQLFYNKYQISLEVVLLQKGYDSLKSFLISSQRFSIYDHLNYQEFYVAPFSAINPNLTQGKSLHNFQLNTLSNDPGKLTSACWNC